MVSRAVRNVRRTNFSFVSAHCASSTKTGSKLREEDLNIFGWEKAENNIYTLFIPMVLGIGL